VEQKSLLVCDDNPTHLLLMKQIFAKRGFRVWTACGGEAGMSLVRTVRPDFLLLDLEMPDVDGISVLESLKTLDGKRPYTLVLSAYGGDERRRQATSVGAEEVWSKPFNAFELTSRVLALAEKSDLTAASL
jgi:CheY-like chemotaxis protein